MRLIAFYNDPYATPDALQFPSYLLRLGEGKFQQNEKNDA